MKFSGCDEIEETPSSDIATEDIWVSVEIESRNTGVLYYNAFPLFPTQTTSLTVSFNKGGAEGDSITLTDGEFIEVLQADQTERLKKSSKDMVHYWAYISNLTSGDFVFNYYRNQQTTIIVSQVVMPDEIQINEPYRLTDFNDFEPIRIDWNTSETSNEIHLKINYHCSPMVGNDSEYITGTLVDQIIQDNGEYDIAPLNQYFPEDNWAHLKQNYSKCRLYTELKRTNEGEIDLALDLDSQIVASQIRKFDLNVNL